MPAHAARHEAPGRTGRRWIVIKRLLMGVVLGLLLVLAGGLAVVLGELPNVAADGGARFGSPPGP
jgi:hypothetical protein